MRRFLDASGRSWEVVAGRQSWGAIVAIFVSGDGTQSLLEAPLAASGYEEGNAELDELDIEGLRELLSRALPKEL